MQKADGRPPLPKGIFQAPAEEAAAQTWTVWNEVDNTCRSLRALSAHILRTATTLEGNISQIERMLGEISKRP